VTQCNLYGYGILCGGASGAQVQWARGFRVPTRGIYRDLEEMERKRLGKSALA